MPLEPGMRIGRIREGRLREAERATDRAGAWQINDRCFLMRARLAYAFGEYARAFALVKTAKERADPENQKRRRAVTQNDGWRFLQGRGVVEGRLLGGCLDVLEFLRGSAAWPDASAFDGAILFLETSEEAPPPAIVARALRSYAANGSLGRIAALLFGRPLERFDEHDAAILGVIADEEGLTGLPIITRMDFGHTDPMFVLPYGVRARIDCDARTFAIVEAAVV